MITREDPVVIAPDMYKVLLENEKVRVMDLTIHPGDSVEMHDHPDMVAYSLTDIENIWTLPDGSEEEVFVKKGQALWHEAFSHAAENTGDEDMHIIIVELKR